MKKLILYLIYWSILLAALPVILMFGWNDAAPCLHLYKLTYGAAYGLIRCAVAISLLVFLLIEMKEIWDD